MTSLIDDRFGAISAMMSAQTPPVGVKSAILDLIVAILEDKREDLGYWEKCHIGGAISAFAMNSGRQDLIWLNLCMVNLDKALVSPSQRSDRYTPRYKAIEQITYEQLREAADFLRSQIRAQ